MPGAIALFNLLLDNWKQHLHLLIYTLYKNTEARLTKKIKNKFRTCSASDDKLKKKEKNKVNFEFFHFNKTKPCKS